jgi:hypothetical protein
MDFPQTAEDGAPLITAERAILGDVCRYVEYCDDGTVVTSKNLVAHSRDRFGDWWDARMNPITDQETGQVATYLVRPRRQDPPNADLVFALDVEGTRYTGLGNGWLLGQGEPGLYRAVGQPPVTGRVEYPAPTIWAWDVAEVVVRRRP